MWWCEVSAMQRAGGTRTLLGRRRPAVDHDNGAVSRMRVKVHPSLACLHDTICFTARPVDGVSAISLPTDEQVCDACTIPDSEAG